MALDKLTYYRPSSLTMWRPIVFILPVLQVSLVLEPLKKCAQAQYYKPFTADLQLGKISQSICLWQPCTAYSIINV